MLGGCKAQTEAVPPTPIPSHTPLPTNTPIPPTATSEPAPTSEPTLTTEGQEDWLPVSELPEPIAGVLVRCQEQPDSFYIIGGVMGRGNNSAWLFNYDINNASWEQLQDMPKPMRGIAAACYEGKIYVAGGTDLENLYDSLHIYDIATDAWSDGSALPDEVMGGALAAWDGKLYHVGGTRDAEHTVARVDVYDIASGIWTAGGSSALTCGAFGFASAQVDQFFYVVGGSGVPSPARYTQRYDMSTDTWEIGPSFTSLRAFSGLAVTELAPVRAGW